MSPLLGLVLIFGVIILAIIFSPKLKVNFGLITMIGAFLIGHWVLGMSSTQIIAYFPGKIVLTFILFTYFSGMIKRTKVFKGIADRILYAFRHKPALIPFAIVLAATAVNASGGGAYAGMSVVGPIALTLADVVGFSPLIAISAIWCGSGLQFWWSNGATPVHMQLITDNVGAQYAQSGLVYILLSNGLILFTSFLLVYIICKGYKPTANVSVMEKPEPFSAFQKKVLGVVCIFVFFISVPNMVQTFAPNVVTAWLSAHVDMYVLLIICNAIFTFMKIEQSDVVIKEDIPWTLIVMLAGTSMLVGLMNNFGTIEYLSGLISGSVPAFLVIPILLLIGGILTMFANGLTVTQTIAPIVFSVTAAMPAVPSLGAYAAMFDGTQGPSISPFSTGGSLALMNVTENQDRAKVMRQMILVMFMNLALQILFGFAGLFNRMQP